MKLKLHRGSLPTRGFALAFITHRYLFHTALGIAAIATLIVNINARQANAQDVGKNSLLYALATGSDVSIVQEVARETDLKPQPSYIEEGTLVAIPHIDFDYGEEIDAEHANLSVPGAIAALPVPDAGESQAPRTRTETYTVQAGDTIASIADRFKVNVGTILWNNNLSERQYIRPGDTLKIPPVSGILVEIKKGDTLSKLAQRYSGSEAEVKTFNKITDETTLALGTEIMIPNGKPPAPQQTAIAIAGRRTEPAKPAPSTTAKKPADVDTASLGAAKLVWPTPGRVITQYYGWRHTGLDIDGDFTSPLYASYDGVVETAGWNSGGYGLQIVIRHTNGMKTRYAHASKLYVKVGDTVKRGETIAMMGSTGRSTGSHLHYELYVGGKRVNPLLYVK